MHVFKLDVKDEELVREMNHLKQEFDILKGLSENWFNEKLSLLAKI